MTAMLPVVAGIILVAAIVQTVTGFGFALVATPLLALTVDPRNAVVATAAAALAMTATVAIRQRHHAEWKVAAMTLAGTVVGLPLGLLVLEVASDPVLTGLIAVAVLCCIAIVWRGVTVPGNRSTVVGVGLLAGVLSTSTGTNGPPLVAVFQGMGYDAATFRATLSVIFAGASVFSLIGFAVAGEMTSTALWIGLIGLPTVQVGYRVGNALFHRIDPQHFRPVVLAALLVSGVVTLVRAVAG